MSIAAIYTTKNRPVLAYFYILLGVADDVRTKITNIQLLFIFFLSASILIKFHSLFFG